MPRNPDKRPCSIPGCKAWAIRDSHPPLCAPHTPGIGGAPLGNRNSLIHGFYLNTLRPEDLEVLEGLDHAATDATLSDEILIVRAALRRLQHMIVTGLTPGPRPQRLAASDYGRFLGLTFQGANTLSRLLRIRHQLPENDRWEAVMDVALDALSKEWDAEL